MAGKIRYWKEKDGRFWARISVPERLQPYLDHPRCEVSEPLGGDRRTALRLHPAAVARLQQVIAIAQSKADAAAPNLKASISPRPAITLADFGHAVWQRYSTALDADKAARASYPRADKIEAEREKLTRKAQAGEIANEPSAILDASLDFLLLLDAQDCDRFTREARLAALKRELAAGQTHQVEHEIDAYLAERGLSAEPDSAERNVLAKHMWTPPSSSLSSKRVESGWVLAYVRPRSAAGWPRALMISADHGPYQIIALSGAVSRTGFPDPRQNR